MVGWEVNSTHKLTLTENETADARVIHYVINQDEMFFWQGLDSPQRDFIMKLIFSAVDLVTEPSKPCKREHCEVCGT